MPIAGLSRESRDDDNDDDDDRVDVNGGARDTAPDGDANGEGRAGYIFHFWKFPAHLESLTQYTPPTQNHRFSIPLRLVGQ